MTSRPAQDRPAPPVLGVVLAGGQARRMGGGDKCLTMLGDVPLLTHVVRRAQPQVRRLILNVNGDPGRFLAYDLPKVPDAIPGRVGPLAGVMTAMRWAEEHAPDCRWVASFPSDTPFIPRDLVARLMLAVATEQADLACAASGNRPHPVVGLWPVALADALEAALKKGMRKIDAWTAAYTLSVVPFAARPVDPFFNINRPEDVATARTLLARLALADLT